MIHRPYRNKTDDELRFILKDAAEAAIAMRGVSEKAEAKYLDQLNEASNEIYQRSKGV